MSANQENAKNKGQGGLLSGGPKQNAGYERQQDPAYNSALSGQQMQAVAKQYGDQLAAIKRDIELRKWAVDQACGMAGAQIEAEAPVIMHPVELAREIHEFLVEGANEQK